MNAKEFLEKMTSIQRNLLDYIDSEDSADSEDKFKNFEDLLIKNNQHELKSFLYLLTNISYNHRRSTNFFNKIERILELLKGDLLKYFSNSELFRIFKSSKRILLYLFEEKIINIDKFVFKGLIEYSSMIKNCPQYFQPEIQPIVQKKWLSNYEREWFCENFSENFLDGFPEIPDDFYEKRKIGENDNYICTLIRNDLIDDFVIYVNENNYPLDSSIYPTIYETNNFVLNYKYLSLIEYATFFGSIKIFKYLQINKVPLSPSLWKFSIHSNNAEILEILEENHVELPDDASYKSLLEESIKCHHNDFAYHIQNNYMQSEADISNIEMINGLNYYNFVFIQNDKINEKLIAYFCKYDYYLLASLLLKTNKIEINKRIIQLANV